MYLIVQVGILFENNIIWFWLCISVFCLHISPTALWSALDPKPLDTLVEFMFHT
jgi:hypothetical protein